MSISEYYMNLPFDLAGSRSKNRFRNEMLWGLKKMLELYSENEDFTIVFDYSCDIEIHKSDGLEFYQVKTQNNNDAYKVSKLTTRNKSGDSILGKLYRLKFSEDYTELDDTILGLVSNAPLHDGKTAHNTVDIIDLSGIEEKAVENIKLKLKDELSLDEDIKLINTMFERTGIDLIQPDKSLVGELTFFFEEHFGSEPKRILMLFRILKQEIDERASYELLLTDYEEILFNKGINSHFLTNLFNKHLENADISLEKAKNFINNNYQNYYKKKIKLLRALPNLLIQINNHNETILNIERKAWQFLTEKLDELPDEENEVIKFIRDTLFKESSLEITEYDVEALVILVMKKIEEGVY